MVGGVFPPISSASTKSGSHRADLRCLHERGQSPCDLTTQGIRTRPQCKPSSKVRAGRNSISDTGPRIG